MRSRLTTTPALSSDDAHVLEAIVEGTVRNTGKDFFQSLVKHLARALGVQHAFVAEFAHGTTRVRTIAYWARDRIVDNFEWELSGTPCEDVIRGELCQHTEGTWRKFPRDEPLVRQHIESYLGVPLRDESGAAMGHLAVFDDRPMQADARRVPSGLRSSRERSRPARPATCDLRPATRAP